MSTKVAKKTCLYGCHEALKAKMVNFNGFSLPIWYSSLKDEHKAVRESAGMFDISHMGILELTGVDAVNVFQTLHTNSQAKSVNTMTYSMMLNEQAGILDDVMFAVTGDSIYLVVNASNKEKIVNWISQKTELTITDLNKKNAFIAIQGPKAVQTVQALFNDNLTDMPRFGLQQKTTTSGVSCTIARSGYTGEDGIEVMIDNAHAPAFWDACIGAGIVPCGLGARDTLRLEAGLPLYGQELSETINPYMTRYKWVVKEDHEFIGKDIISGNKDNQEMATVGLKMQDRMIPRTGYAIEEGGHVTSGTMSPVLDAPIAMALVKKSYAVIGTELTVTIRSKPYKANVIKVPFIS